MLFALPAQSIALLVLAAILVTAAGAGAWFFFRRSQRQQTRIAALNAEIEDLNLREHILQRENQERNELEKILERGKREWEAIFDSVQDAILVADSSGRIIRCNRMAAKMLNRSFDQIVNTPIASVLVSDFDTAEIRPFSRRSATNEPLTGELHIAKKNGWFDVDRFPIYLDDDNPGTIFVLRDITERKRNESIIRRQNQHLEALINNSPVAIVTLDLNQRVLSCNPAFESTFGYSAGEVMGGSLHQLLDNELAQAETANLTSKVMAGEKVKAITQRRRKDGSVVDVEVSAVPLVVEGEMTSALWLYHDITNLMQARRAAEQADRAKSEFLANMSHEIRTPMNGIIGMIELTLGTDLSDEQYDFLVGARDSADALLSVLNDVLDISRLEAHQVLLENIDFYLAAMVDNVAQTLANRAEAKGLELISYIDHRIPTYLRGDPGRLRQVLVNLVENAIKFTEVGEILIQTEMVSEDPAGAVLRFSVTDTGIGIPAERQTAIFDRFVQADGSTTRKYGGTGLGLSISRQLAEMMGGQIGLTSEAGRGSTFWFTAHLGRSTSPESVEPPDSGELHDVRVLVVDDNYTNLRVLARTLESFGCRVSTLSSDYDVMPALQRSLMLDDPFRVLLLDLQMPAFSGETLLSRIRADAQFSGLRVVSMMTMSKRSAMTREQVLEYSSYLLKPVKRAQLREILEGVLGLQVGGRPSKRRTGGLRLRTGALPNRNLQILLVEDNRINQKMTRALLARYGHTVDVASNGLEALRALASKRFDLIFLDVQMPEMDGFEVARRIRAIEGRTRHTPIVALTAHAMPEDRQRCLDAGMDDYIAKPLEPQRVLQILDQRARSTAVLTPNRAGENGDRGAIILGASTAGTGRIVVDPADFPLLDIEGALPRFGQDKLFYQSLLHDFTNSLPEKLAEIQNARNNKGCQEIAFLAHNLRGLAANFGALRLAELAHSLDTAGKGEDLSKAEEIITLIEPVIAELVARANNRQGAQANNRQGAQANKRQGAA